MTIHDDLREVMGCPFCGENPAVSEREFMGEYPIWTVQCHSNECGAQRVMVEDTSKADAIATWNTRPALLARQEGEDAAKWITAWRNRFIDEKTHRLQAGASMCYEEARAHAEESANQFETAFAEELRKRADAARSGGGG